MKKGLKKRLSALAVCTTMLSSLSAVVPAPVSADADVNFAKALQYSIYFYDANMCGTDVSENNAYKWRGDCHTYDAKLKLDTTNTNLSADFISKYKSVLDPDGDGCVDVSGGFHDAGDHVKFGLPEAYSGSTLGWGYYEFRDSYRKTGQDKHIETILRYFNDYFMRSTFLDENGEVVAFCYQVGDGDIDHAYWNAPELDTMERKGWFATSEKPTTDCVMNTVASLTANYLNFRDTDKEYAEKNLKYAKALYNFAEKNDKQKGLADDGPKGYYGSQKWEDDYCWGSVWLYLATGEEQYINSALGILGNDYYAPPTYPHCWNDVWTGALCLIAEADDAENGALVQKFRDISGKSEYEITDFWSQIAKACDNWISGNMATITPGGYAFLNQWGSARYNTSGQFTALVYDKHHGGASKYSEWAKGQMTYLMGDNPIDRCYIVGYSDNSAKYPHHRAASGLTMAEDTREQKHVLYGALVGGPGANDEHIDKTSDWIYNEVTIDYNAAFVGACAGEYEFFGDDSMKVTPDFPPAESEEETETKYWVEAFAKEDGKVTDVTFYVYGSAPVADKKLSVRYYFDATGMTNVDNLEFRKYYDQTEMETDYKGTLSGVKKYKDNIYYVEVSWDGYAIANSNKKYEFAIGSYDTSNPWVSSDDWSFQGLSTTADTFKEAPNICVYSDGVLVGGTEPDGTTSQKDVKILSIKKSVLGMKSADKAEDINADSQINAFDVLSKKSEMLKK